MSAGPVSPGLIFPKADLSAASLLCYAIGADGKWTAASTGAFASGAASILKYLDSIVLTIDQMLLEAISVDANYMNRLEGPIDASAVVTENMRRQQGAGANGASATDPGNITALCVGYSGIKLSWAYNLATNHNDVYTMYAKWQRLGIGVQGVGAQKSGLSLQLADVSYTAVDGTTGIPPISIVRA